MIIHYLLLSTIVQPRSSARLQPRAYPISTSSALAKLQKREAQFSHNSHVSHNPDSPLTGTVLQHKKQESRVDLTPTPTQQIKGRLTLPDSQAASQDPVFTCNNTHPSSLEVSTNLPSQDPTKPNPHLLSQTSNSDQCPSADEEAAVIAAADAVEVAALAIAAVEAAAESVLVVCI